MGQALGARCLCGEAIRFISGVGRLGKYNLIERIATGGMGEIYRATLPGVEGFERDIAIKRMLPHLSADQSFIDMLVKEAKLTVLLKHPNIVQVYDLAREAGQYYIAMELVQGVNVAQMLKLCIRNRMLLPPEVGVYVMAQVLKGLAYAHDFTDSSGQKMSVLHRDVTPQNILVTKEAWVKITDFGIAKARNEISTTSTGIIKGKLGYIAPEQIAGRKADERVDIFCAGIVLWEMLAARRLFKGQDELDSFRLIAEANVPPLTTYRKDVPAPLEAALRKALTKTPEERYATADEFYMGLVKAVFPRSLDDFHSVARKYCQEHPELFVGDSPADQGAAASSHPTGSTGSLDATVPLPVPGQIDAAKLEKITKYIVQAEQAGRGRLLAAALVVVLVIAGLVGVIVNQSQSAPDPARAPMSPSEAAPAPQVVAPLTNEEVQLNVDGHKARFAECYSQEASSLRKLSSLKASLVIPSTGGVADVRYQPAKETLGSAGQCLDAILRALQFRNHSQPSFLALVDLPSPKAALRDEEPQKSREAPKALTEQDISSALQKSFRKLKGCGAGKPGLPEFRAKLVIEASGKVSGVALDPVVEAVDQCLKEVLGAMAFRPHARRLEVSVPLQFQSVAN